MDKNDNNYESPPPQSRPTMSKGANINTKDGFAIGKRE
jgi:hypothetical protein